MLVAYLLVGTLCYSLGSGALFSDEDGNPIAACDDGPLVNVTGPDNITRSEPTANPNAGYIDGLYFSVVTFTTVGYGDMGPQTQGWRLFSCFFALAGIAVGGGCLGIVLEEVSKYRQRRNLFFAEQVDIDCNPHANISGSWCRAQMISRNVRVGQTSSRGTTATRAAE